MNAEPTAPPASTWNTRSGIVNAAMNASYSRPVPNCWATTTLRTSPSSRLTTKPAITTSEAAASFRAWWYIRRLPGPAAHGAEPPGATDDGGVRTLLEGVVERREVDVVAVPPPQRPRDQP